MKNFEEHSSVSLRLHRFTAFLIKDFKSAIHPICNSRRQIFAYKVQILFMSVSKCIKDARKMSSSLEFSRSFYIRYFESE